LNRFVQIGTILIASFVIGVAVNQINPHGIPLRLLCMSLSFGSHQKDYVETSVDSTLLLFFQGSGLFIDIRSEQDYNIDHIKGAVSIPFFELFRHPENFPKIDSTSTLIVYDYHLNSNRAFLSARFLANRGFKNVTVMRGGFIEWLDKGYPVERHKR